VENDNGSIIIGALIAGVVCGLIPLVYGLIKRQQALAFGGLVACIAAGFVLGLILALPMAALFAWLIWRADKRSTGTRSSSPYAGMGRTDTAGTTAGTTVEDRETAGRM
jgi:membrane protein implicated in regulation of membrane protease activity